MSPFKNLRRKKGSQPVSEKLRNWLKSTPTQSTSHEPVLWVMTLALLAEQAQAARQNVLTEAIAKDAANQTEPANTSDTFPTTEPTSHAEQPLEEDTDAAIQIQTEAQPLQPLDDPQPDLYKETLALNTATTASSGSAATSKQTADTEPPEPLTEPETPTEEAEAPAESGSRKLYPVAPIGGGGGGGSSSMSLAPTGASGSVIKGYLDQAIVWRDKDGDGAFTFVDANGDGMFQIGETVNDYYAITDERGNFKSLGGTGAFHVFSGIDRYGTGLQFEGVLLAPETAKVVTSLTTLVQAVRESSSTNKLTPEQAVTAVKNMLGLGTSVTADDLLNIDPVTQAYSSTSSTDQAKYLGLYAKSAQLANILVVGAAAVQKVDASVSLADASLSVVRALGETYLSSVSAPGGAVQAVDLGSTTFITQVMQSIDSAVPLTAVADITTALAQVNQAVQNVVAQADVNSKASLNALVATEYASQYNLTADILGKPNADGSLRTLDAAAYSGTQLDAKLQDIQSVVGSLSAPAQGGRGQAVKPLLVDPNDASASASSGLSLVGGERLSSGYAYLLKQDLNKDVVAGDKLVVLVNGVAFKTVTLSAEQVTAQKMQVALDASMWGNLSPNAVTANYVVTTRFDTAAGVLGGESRPWVVAVDNQVSVPQVAWKTDTGRTGELLTLQDGITQNPNFTLVGNAELNAQVKFGVRWNEGAEQFYTVQASGQRFEVASQTLNMTSEGRYTVRLQQVDPAGNVSAWSNAVTLVVDQTAPVVTLPVFDNLLSLGELNAVSLAVQVDDPLAKLSWSIRNAQGSVVDLTLTESQRLLSGNFSGLAEGRYLLSVAATDVAGNTSVAATREVVVDKTPPTLQLPVISGATSASASVINLATASSGLVLTGSSSGAETGQIVKLSLVAQEGTSRLEVQSALTNGEYAISLSAAQLTALTDGAYTLSGEVADKAGNLVQVSQALRVDKTPPVLSLAVEGSDALRINQTMIQKGFALAGAAIGVENGQTLTLTLANTAGDKSWTFQTQVQNGAYRLALTAADLKGFTDGQYAATVNVSDAAGNPAVLQQSLSGAVTAPVVSVVPLSDNLLNATELQTPLQLPVTVTGTDTRLNFSLTRTGDTQTTFDTLLSLQNGKLTGNLGSLQDGEYRIALQALDGNGNASALVTQRFVVDRTPPVLSLSAPATLTGTDTRFLNLSVKATGLTFSGKADGAEAGQTVALTLDSPAAPGVSLGQWTAVANAKGEFALTLAKETLAPWSDGSYVLRAQVADRAGNAATPVTLPFTVDTTLPSAPTSLGMTAQSYNDTGVSSTDRITQKTTGLQFQGQAQAADQGATVLLYDQGKGLEGATATVLADGTFTFANVSLASGNHALTARLRDPAGNLSVLPSGGASLAITIDNQAPAVTKLTTPGAAVYDRGQSLTFVVQGNEALYVTGTPRLNLQFDSPTPRYASYVSGSGTNQLVFSYKVASGDLDTNGIGLSSLDLRGGTVTDIAGNALNLTLNNVGALSGVKINGAVVGSSADGYLVNVTIFSDANRDNEISAGEAVGGSIGAGVFSIPGGTGQLIMRGGTDISTGQPFAVQYEAPEGFLVINPVTTLMAQYQSLKGYVAATATDEAHYTVSTATVASKVLGAGLFAGSLPSALTNSSTLVEDVLSSYDPFREAANTSASVADRTAAVTYQKTAAMLAVLSDVGGQVLAGTDGVGGHLATETSVALMRAVANGLDNLSGGLQPALQNAQMVSGFMQAAVQTVGLNLTAAQSAALDGVASVMAKANELIANVDPAALSQGTSAVALLRQIVSVQSVVQGDYLSDLKLQMGNDPSVTAKLSAAIMKDSLASAVANAIVGPIVPSSFKLAAYQEGGTPSAALSVAESDGAGHGSVVNVRVTRSGGLDGTVVLGYQVSGSASLDPARFAGGVTPSGTLTFGPDVTEQWLKIEWVDNQIRQPDELISLTLKDLYGNSQFTDLNGALVAEPKVLITLQDDDPNTPVVTVPTALAAGEGTTVVAEGVSVDYYDAQATLVVNLQALHGTLALQTSAGAVLQSLTPGDSSGTYSLQGKLADINNALARLTFTSDPLALDGGLRITAQPSGRSVVGAADVPISVHASPEVSVPTAPVAVVAGTLSRVSVPLVADQDSDEISLQLTTGEGEWVLAASDNVWVEHPDIGNVILHGNPLDVNDVLSGLSLIATPGRSNVNVSVEVSDGDPLTEDAQSSYVMAVQHAPPILQWPLSVNYKGGLASALPSVSLSDADSALLTLTVSASAGTLLPGDMAGDASLLAQSDAALTLQGSAASVQTTLKSFLYTAPLSGQPSLVLSVTDGETTVTKNVSVTVLDNQAPQAGGDLTLAGTVEDTPRLITLKPSTLSDTDSAAVPTQIRILKVEGGTLTLPNGDALTLGTAGTLVTLNNGSADVRFAPEANRTAAAALTYAVVDPALASLNSEAATVTLPLTSVNDAPSLQIPGSALGFTENGAALWVASNVSLTDTDSTLLAGATVRLTQAQTGDVLSYPGSGTLASEYQFDAATSTATLTLTGQATLEDYKVALQSVTYRNALDSLSGITRRLDITVTDVSSSAQGTALTSAVASRNLEVTPVNDAPTLKGPGSIAVFNESTSSSKLLVSLQPATGLTAVDPDGGVPATIVAARLTFTDGYRPGEDLLSFPVTDSAVKSSFDATTGVLTLKGEASLSSYTSWVSALTYQNASANPSVGLRTASLVLTDSLGASAAPASVTWRVSAFNDQAELDLSGSDFTQLNNSAGFSSDVGAVAIAPNASLRDVDGSQMRSLKVVLNGAQVGDTLQLSLAAMSAAKAANLNVTQNGASLEITASGATQLASLSAFESVLRGVQFDHVKQGTTDAVTGSRTLTVTGVDDSGTALTSASVALSLSPGALSRVISSDDPTDSSKKIYTVAVSGLVNSESLLVDLSSALVATASGRQTVANLFKATAMDASLLNPSGLTSINLVGNKAANRIIGSDGSDVISGGGGADTLSGGEGDDTFVATALDLASLTVDGGNAGTAGDSLRLIGAGAQLNNAAFAGIQGIENLLLAGSSAFQVVTQRFAKVDASAQLLGGVSVDTSARTDAVALWGSAQADDLRGGAGNDVLQGGAGDDTLVGGAGADTLTGGAGNDVFVWRASEARANLPDVITDLTVGDALQLQGLAGLQWRGQASLRSDATLDAWLGVANGRTYVYVESTPDAPASAWLSIEITSGIRTRGWVATDNAQGLLLSIPVNAPSVLAVPSSSEKLPLTASGKGVATLLSGVSVQDAANDLQSVSVVARGGTFNLDGNTGLTQYEWVGTTAQVNLKLSQLTYVATQRSDKGTVNALDLVVHDDVNLDSLSSQSIFFTVPNTAPVLTSTVTSALQTTVGKALVVQGLSVADVDGGVLAMTVSSASTLGVWVQTSGTALQGVVASGWGGSSLTLRGTAAQLNAFLAQNDTSGLSFSAQTVGTGALKLSVSDDRNDVSVARNLALTVQPSAPGAPDLLPSSDSGSSATDNFTNVVAPGFSVPLAGSGAAAGMTLQLRAEGNLVGAHVLTAAEVTDQLAVVRVGEGLDNPTSVSLREGLANFSAQLQSGSVLSATSPTLQITIDTSAPVPTVPSLAAADDSGVSATDGMTRLNSGLTFSMRSEAGSRVSLFEGSKELGSALADAQGIVSVDLSLTSGHHLITARATDLYGNVSDFSSASSVIIDTLAPTVTDSRSLYPSDGAYGRKSVLNFDLAFAEPVKASADAFLNLTWDGLATPVQAKLSAVQPAPAEGDAEGRAAVAAGGTLVLRFSYTVSSTDDAPQGLRLVGPQGVSDLAGNGVTTFSKVLSSVKLDIAAGNPPPVPAPDVTTATAAGVTDAVSAQGNLLSNDVDPEGETLTLTGLGAGTLKLSELPALGASAVKGLYGELTADSSGKFTFVPYANRALAQGQSVKDEFTYSVTDGNKNFTTSKLTVTVQGVNDPPTLGTWANPSITELDLGNKTQDVALTGTLAVSDPDANATIVFGLVNQASTTKTLSAEGVYVTLNVDASNGSYTLIKKNGTIEALSQGEMVSDRFEITVSDGLAPQLQKALVVQIVGGNDAPSTVSVQADVKEDAALLKGQLTASDVDVKDTTASFKLDQEVAGLSLGSNGAWQFDATNGAYQYLAKDEVLTVKAPYTVTDNLGATAKGELTLVVTGLDDLPSLKVPDLLKGFSLERGTLTLPLDKKIPSLSALDVDGIGNSTYTAELISRTPNVPVPKWLSLNSTTWTLETLSQLSFDAVRVPMTEIPETHYLLSLRLTDHSLDATHDYDFDLTVARGLDRPILPTFHVDPTSSLPSGMFTPLADILDVQFMNPLHAIEWTNLPPGLQVSLKVGDLSLAELPASFFKSYPVMDGTTVQSLRIPVDSIKDIVLKVDNAVNVDHLAYRVWSGETDGEYSDDSHFSEWTNPFQASLFSDVTRDLLTGTDPVIDSLTGRQAYFGSAFDFENPPVTSTDGGTAIANVTSHHGVIADANFGQVFFADASTGQFSQSRALFSTDTTTTTYKGLAGTPFDDILTANDFGSVLYAGTGGNDLLFGGGENDVLLDGNKFIAKGVTFKDVLVGNAGADSFVLMKPTNASEGTLEVMISDYNPMEGDRLILAGFGTEEPKIEPVDEVTHLQPVTLDNGNLLLWVDLSFVRLVDNHFNLRISDFDKIA